MKNLMKKMLSSIVLITTMQGTSYAAEQLNLQLADESVKFPKLSKSYHNQALRFEYDQILRLEQGLNKDQIRSILGNPHFSEGLFFVREWNYILDIRVPETQNYQHCQLRIDFDKEYLAKAYYWQGEACEGLARYGVNNDVNNDVNVTAQKNAVEAFQASVLFAFDRYDVNAINLNFSQIADIAKAIRQSGSKQITVTGYADQLGNMGYNHALSAQRANTVASLLHQEGIDLNHIKINAQGGTNKYKNCQGLTKTVKTVACIAPNRRVNVVW